MADIRADIMAYLRQEIENKYPFESPPADMKAYRALKDLEAGDSSSTIELLVDELHDLEVAAADRPIIDEGMGGVSREIAAGQAEIHSKWIDFLEQ